MNSSRWPHYADVIRLGLAASLLLNVARAQQQPQPTAATDEGKSGATLSDLRSEVRELKDIVLQLKQETSASRAEIARLRQELEANGSALVGDHTPPPPSEEPTPVDLRVGQLEEDQQLLNAKVDEQYQTKVESASKYRVRF